MERTIHCGESRGSQQLQNKDGVQEKDIPHEYVEKYIARELEVDVVHKSNKDDATITVARMIYKDTDQELGEVPDLESCHQEEGFRDVRLGEDLSEDQRHMLKDLTRRYTDVFTDMPGETYVI